MKFVLDDYIKIAILLGEGNFSGVGNEHFLCWWVGFCPPPPPSKGFLPSGRFRGRGGTVHTWWGQQVR